MMRAAVSFRDCRFTALPLGEGGEAGGQYWTIADQKPDESDAEEWTTLWPARSDRPLAGRAYDVAGPVEAGLRAISPQAARLLVYRNAAIEERITRRTYELEQRIERLERAAFVPSERGTELLTRAITQLRDELGDEIGEISPEEEAELWEMVDFAAVHEKD
jgi:hypothetical protein